ncbi:hypothetical protein GCM10009647_064780 [Streptomyces sanglieri]
MADPARVHQLGEDPAARRMHRGGDLAPGGDLLRAVQPGGGGVALAHHRRLDALRDDEARRGALGVVLGDEIRGGAALTGAAAGHRSHRDAVGEPGAGKVDRVECGGHGDSRTIYVVGQLSAPTPL